MSLKIVRLAQMFNFQKEQIYKPTAHGALLLACTVYLVFFNSFQ